MKLNKSLAPYASILYLLPVLMLCGAVAMFFLYQGKVNAASSALQQAIEAEVDHRADLVNTQVRQLRARVIEAGELLLRELPLPLSDLPLIVLRELDQDIAHRQTTWGEATIVSLDPDARQFHYESREFQTSLLFLVTQGESVGPQAIRTESGFELFIAEPLSNPNWVVVARISASDLATPLAQGLSGVGRVVLEQMPGNAEGMVLYSLGDNPAGPQVVRTTNVREWRLSYAPSQAFLDRYAGAGRIPYVLIYVFALGFVVSLGLVAWLFLQRSATGEAAIASGSGDGVVVPPRAKGRSKIHPKMAREKTEEEEDTESEPAEPDAELRAEDDFTPLSAEKLPSKIFRANDIRGLVGEQVNEDFARHLGRSFAQMARGSGVERVFVGCDSRSSSQALSQALVRGILESGCDVTDLGLCPTPLLAWAMQHREGTAAVMVTASHNPAEYNGFKLLLGGTTLYGDGIRKLRESMVRAKFSYGRGTLAKLDATENYLHALEKDIAPLKGIKVVVDAANGAAGPLAVKALSALGCLVDPLYCEPEGDFPNHPPDPSRPENLEALCERVRSTGAHLGIALDGDGDRIVAVTEQGEALDPDQLMMLFAEQVLTLSPAGSIVSDVKSSRTLTDFIERLGGRSLISRSGRSFVQNAFRESGALLAGEYSSHYFFGDRWIGFDDGIYAAARLLEILALYNKPLSEILSALPKQMGTGEIIVEVPDEEKFEIVQRFIDTADFPGAKLLEIDGLRVEYREAWGLVRASNTSPALTLRFEARSESALTKLQSMFREQLKAVAPDLQLDF